MIPLIFPKVPQSSLGILRIPQLLTVFQPFFHITSCHPPTNPLLAPHQGIGEKWKKCGPAKAHPRHYLAICKESTGTGDPGHPQNPQGSTSKGGKWLLDALLVLKTEKSTEAVKCQSQVGFFSHKKNWVTQSMTQVFKFGAVGCGFQTVMVQPTYGNPSFFPRISTQAVLVGGAMPQRSPKNSLTPLITDMPSWKITHFQ